MPGADMPEGVGHVFGRQDPVRHDDVVDDVVYLAHGAVHVCLSSNFARLGCGPSKGSEPPASEGARAEQSNDRGRRSGLAEVGEHAF